MQRLLDDASKLSGVEYDMSNLNDVYEAIHVVQTELGITGTTALEASETISGSFASMKSAWQNFLVGLADGNQNMDALTQKLATSIATVGKNLIPRVVTTVKSIGTVLITNITKYGDDAVKKLGQAFADGIPLLVSKGGDLIARFSESLKNNFPKIVQSGLDLIVKFAQGIMDALPQLIAKAPTIIMNLVSALIRALPQVLSAGVRFIGTLGEGIINAVPALITSVGQIGTNLVQGLWNGIGNAKDWVLNKIKGFGKDILNGLKSFFGIHSPSKVMESEVGKQLALGVAQGITKNTDKVDKAAEEMGSKILKAAEQTLKEYKRIHKMSINEEVAYWAEIVKQTKKGTEARISAEDKYFDAVERQQQEIRELEEEKAREREEQLAEYKSQLEEYQEAHKDFVDQIMKQTDLFDPFKMAEEAVSGEDLIANLQSQVDGLENYSDIMEALEAKIGDTKLMEALKEFGTDSLAELTAISKMTDEQLDQYVKLYDQKYALADATAEANLDTASKIASVSSKISAVSRTISAAASKIDDGLKMYNGIKYDPTVDYQAEINRLTEQGAPADVIYSYQKKRAAKVAGEGLDPVTGAKLSEHAEGGILEEPTIFGYSPKSNTFHLGGEAGKEAIAPIDVLQGYVRSAVRAENEGQASLMQRMIALLEVIAEKDSTIEVDGRELGRLVRSYA